MLDLNSTSNRTRPVPGLLRTLLVGAMLLVGAFTARSQVIVTASAGVTGPSPYANLNTAFAFINNGTHQGAITITVVSNTTEPAPPTPLLRSFAPSSYTSVLITCTGNVTVNSAAAPTATRGIIELLGADNVTIDGDDPGTPGTRNLTFQMVTTTTAGTACVKLASNSTTGLDGADNNTVRNCTIIGGRSSATVTTTSWGIQMSNGTAGTGGAYSSLNTRIENNAITRCYTGIGAIGVSATYLNTGTIIRNNVLGSATSADNIGLRGILATYTQSTASGNSVIIEGNDVRVGDYGTTGYSATVAGIELGIANAGATIARNNIHDVNQPTSGGYGAHGIYVTSNTNNSGLVIRNNFIRDMKMVVYQTSATSTFIPCGVFFSSGGTNVAFDHNTVVMGTQLGSGSNFSSFGVNASSTVVTFASFRNNIVINRHNSTTAYGFYTGSTASISAAAVDNNDYFVTGSAHVGYYNAAARTTLAAWQTATGKDAASINVDGPFVSATDLHANLGDPNAPFFNQTGASGTGVVLDFDGDFRPTPPSIGADELAPLPSCSTAPTAGAITGNTNYCTGSAGTLLSLTGASNGPGISYQWRSSTTSGGPYNTVLGTSNTQNTGALAATTYYQVEVTCAGFGNAFTAEFVVNVTTTPTATAGLSGTACTGAPLNLTGTSPTGTSFSWTGPNAFASTVQHPQVTATATAANTGTYSLTTSLNGCVSPASTVAVSVNNAPVMSSLTATPATICVNGTSQLQATASVSSLVNTYSFATGTGSTLDPMTGAASLIGTGNDDTPTAVDNAIGFSFTFNGTPYTDYRVSPDGWIRMGTGAAANQFTNAVRSGACRSRDPRATPSA